MIYPNFENKHKKESMVKPEDFINYRKSRGRYDFPAPTGVILSYGNDLIDYVLKNSKVTKMEHFYYDFYLLNDTQNKIAFLTRFGLGAPAAVNVVEQMIGFGVKKFLSIGSAGSLQKDLKAGDIVICDKAIRDEGTSYHYIGADKYAKAPQKMLEKIKKTLSSKNINYSIGSSWTIDAPYRETVEEAKHYQKEGVKTVEMEASALFTVANYRKVELGSMFVISDSLAEMEWSPQFHIPEKSEGLANLYHAAVKILSE